MSSVETQTTLKQPQAGKYKKKRTIANLLQTDQRMPGTNTNEKKTYIKEYFEDHLPKTPESISHESEPTESISMDTKTVNPATVEKPEFKKSKIKDYVFEAECEATVAQSLNKAYALKKANALTKNFNPLEIKSVKLEPVVNCQVEKLPKQKRVSTRVRQRRSKIKDYISDENSAECNAKSLSTNLIQT